MSALHRSYASSHATRDDNDESLLSAVLDGETGRTESGAFLTAMRQDE